MEPQSPFICPHIKCPYSIRENCLLVLFSQQLEMLSFLNSWFRFFCINDLLVMNKTFSNMVTQEANPPRILLVLYSYKLKTSFI